jgi:hypothetical protein
MMRNLLITLFVSCAIALSAQHGRVTPIDSIVYVVADSLKVGKDLPTNFGGYYTSARRTDTFTIEGVVTFDPRLYGLSTSRKAAWLQLPGVDSFAGIHVMVDNGRLNSLTGLGPGSGGANLPTLLSDVKFYENFRPGFTVKVTGVLDVFSQYKQLLLFPEESEITNFTPTTITPSVREITDFSRLDAGSGDQVTQYYPGEKYEGMLVEFKNVVVTDVSGGPSRYFWSIQDNNGNKLGVYDLSGFFRNDAQTDSAIDPRNFMPPAAGTRLAYIRGVVQQLSAQGRNQYQLSPRYKDDIGPVLAAPPVVANVTNSPVVPTSLQTVTITAEVTDDISVDSVSIFYKLPNESTFTRIEMSTTPGSDIYTATLPASGQDRGTVTYHIFAKDGDGNYRYYPDSLDGSGFSYLTLNNGISKIRDIQFTEVANGNSNFINKSVPLNINARVTAANNPVDLGIVYVQDTVDLWSGIELRGNSNLSRLQRSEVVNITKGYIREAFGVTVIDSVEYTIVTSSNVPQITPLAADPNVLATRNLTSEAYEGVLVELTNVKVNSLNPDGTSNFGEWAVGTSDTANAAQYRVDDLSNDINQGFNVDSLTLGQDLAFIRGIAYFSFSNNKLLPRNRSDIAGFMARDTATVVDTTNDTMNIVVNSRNLNLYPNPNNGTFTIGFEEVQSNATLSVFDRTGRMVYTNNVNGNQAVISTNLSKGIYIVQVQNKTEIYTGKLIIK